MAVCKMRLKFESDDSRHPEQYTVHMFAICLLQRYLQIECPLTNNMLLEGFSPC